MQFFVYGSQCYYNVCVLDSFNTAMLFRPKPQRRSWFDGEPAVVPESLCYEIAASKSKENVPVKTEQEEKYFLILNHFTTQPKIDFGKVSVKN